MAGHADPGQLASQRAMAALTSRKELVETAFIENQLGVPRRVILEKHLNYPSDQVQEMLKESDREQEQRAKLALQTAQAKALLRPPSGGAKQPPAQQASQRSQSGKGS